MARLRASEASAAKTIASLRDALHEESCKAASLEGRIEAVEEELSQVQIRAPALVSRYPCHVDAHMSKAD